MRSFHTMCLLLILIINTSLYAQPSLPSDAIAIDADTLVMKILPRQQNTTDPNASPRDSVGIDVGSTDSTFVKVRKDMSVVSSNIEDVVRTKREWFSSIAAGVGFVGNGKIDIDASIYRLIVYGKLYYNEKINKYEKRPIAEVKISSRIVDGIGDSLRSIRDYILSKKGSPLTLEWSPDFLLSWTYGQPDVGVEQFWAQGRGYLSGRGYPVPENVGFGISGGYTVALNLDMSVNDDTGRAVGTVRLYGEASIQGNLVFGESLVKSLFALETKKMASIASIDYRIGIVLNNKAESTIGFVGNLSLAALDGFRGGGQIVYGQKF